MQEGHFHSFFYMLPILLPLPERGSESIKFSLSPISRFLRLPGSAQSLQNVGRETHVKIIFYYQCKIIRQLYERPREIRRRRKLCSPPVSRSPSPRPVILIRGQSYSRARAIYVGVRIRTKSDQRNCKYVVRMGSLVNMGDHA